MLLLCRLALWLSEACPILSQPMTGAPANRILFILALVDVR
jgi:hypothetical protein